MKNLLLKVFSNLKSISSFHKVAALGVVFFLLVCSTASATHYRYGSITYKYVPMPPGGVGACAIEVTVSQAWRESFGHFAGIPVVGSVTTSSTTTLVLEEIGGGVVTTEPIFLTATTVNLVDDWYFGVFKKVFVLPLPAKEYLLSFASCCRISTLINNADGDFRSECKVTACGLSNESPVSSLSPIVKLSKGLSPAAFVIPGSDPDLDPITFRLATYAEAIAVGGGANAPTFAVSPTGHATISTVGYATGDQLNAFVAIEDPSGAKTMVDFLIEIVDSASVISTPPMFDFSITPPPAPCLEVNEGDSLWFKVVAKDSDTGDVVTITAVGVPLGAVVTPGNPSAGGNPDTMMICWVPGPGDVGLSVISFTAEDASALTALTSVCILVKADTGCVAAGSLTLMSDTSWRKSTVETGTNLSGVWGGVGGVLPGDGTFTLPALVGQPYSFPSIDSVPGAEVIKTGRDVTYFRKYFTIGGDDDVAARIRMTVDDHVEVYVNGFLVVAQYTGQGANFKNPPFDADLQADGTIVNPNGGGEAFSSVTFSELDDIFVTGVNSLTLAVRNYAKPSDKGGFSFRMDLDYLIKSADCDVLDSCVSDSSWEKSTVVTPSNFSGFWGGVSSLPATATYTLNAMEGQPYGFHSIDSVPGARTIKTENNITYFRKEFTMLDNTGVDSRFRMTVDDGMEIYINGKLIAREENVPVGNRKLPGHDLNFVAGGPVFVNGFAGGDPFDFVSAVDLDTVFIAGLNEIVLAVRNFSKVGDKGGFSFRMDLTKGGVSVVKKSNDNVAAQVFAEVELPMQLYPNPTSSLINLIVKEDVGVADGEVYVLDLNGRVLQQHTFNTQEVQLNLDGYSSGIYLIKVNAGGKTHTAKVLKQ